jgi:hypothetical protein
MVNYVTTQGIYRDFSDIAILSMKNGEAKLIQHLTSIKDGNSYHEVRETVIPVVDNEDRESLAVRLNKDSNVIINTSGKLAALKLAV